MLLNIFKKYKDSDFIKPPVEQPTFKILLEMARTKNLLTNGKYFFHCKFVKPSLEFIQEDEHAYNFYVLSIINGETGAIENKFLFYQKWLDSQIELYYGYSKILSEIYGTVNNSSITKLDIMDYYQMEILSQINENISYIYNDNLVDEVKEIIIEHIKREIVDFVKSLTVYQAFMVDHAHFFNQASYDLFYFSQQSEKKTDFDDIKEYNNFLSSFMVNYYIVNNHLPKITPTLSASTI